MHCAVCAAQRGQGVSNNNKERKKKKKKKREIALAIDPSAPRIQGIHIANISIVRMNSNCVKKSRGAEWLFFLRPLV